MPSTSFRHGRKSRSRRKKTRRAPKTHRIDRSLNEDTEDDPIDIAVERRLPDGQLRQRIRQLSREISRALGQRQELWLDLEIVLNEHAIRREAAYFDVGFEHGFAAGRSAAKRLRTSARELAAKLRSVAIQNGSRDDALLALLDAAHALAVKSEQPAPKTKRPSGTQTATAKYSSAAILRASRGSIARDAEWALH